MNQVFLLKLECFTENLLCWRTPNHLSLSYSHREELARLQPLLPLLIFQPYCASPCAHSGSISQSTHLLNGPNILYWEVYVIFKQYEERETELLNKERQTDSVMSVWWECNTNQIGNSAYPSQRPQVTSALETPVYIRDLWYFLIANTSKAFEGLGKKTIMGYTHP